ncbi:MAG: ADP-ribosylglycohydrolase family protein [Planctomycetota bacterium]|nr:ADP-ribosylglycohydrolase family protein [Planctomycetota bacterium]
MRANLFIVIVTVLVFCNSTLADRDILADTYLDKLHGMWLGEILGNYAGRPYEGNCARGGLVVTVDWNSFINTDPWHGDDDTCFEYAYMNVLKSNATPSNADIKAAWETHVPLPSFYIANKQARWLMADGLAPPQTGSINKNMHWYAIDSQITTEAMGVAAPGLRQRSSDLAGQFGSVTNDGYAVHAAQFYSAMYAAAAFESDTETLVAKGLEVVPVTSRTHQIIQDVVGWYSADKSDGSLDWRATQEKIYDKYVGTDSKGRYRYWIESTVNTGLTTMAVLYGQGDFKETVEIGVLGGFDCDCNPATAGGLIGLINGYSGLPTNLTGAASDNYHVDTLVNILKDTTISQVAADWQTVAEAQILAAGGSISGSGAGRTYHLPDADNIGPLTEKPDPVGPKGLVGQVLAAGGTVTVSSSIEYHNPDNDRQNLDAIIDGITDVSYNGHLPYMTDDGENSQPVGGDYYQLNFDRDVTFGAVVFYEGDIKWNGINSDPMDSEPRGGYFLNLIVEVGDDGAFIEVSDLHMSEALDKFEYFQIIELTFDQVVGDAIRIRGDAGGTGQFTSIVELEAYVPEPATVVLLAFGGWVLLLMRRNRQTG